MNSKNFVTLDKVGKGLAKLPGMVPIIEEERAAVHAAAFVEYARSTANLTQKELAKRLGVTQARISQMEKGEGPYGLSIALLEKVAEACGGKLHLSYVPERQTEVEETDALAAEPSEAAAVHSAAAS